MIRPAVVDDIAAILSLIHELAQYEREPDAVHNTADALTETLFGDLPSVFALVAEVQGRVVGTAIWFINYSTWTGRHGIYLEELIVTSEHRGSGLGRALLATLGQICVERGYTRLEWSVLDWNAPALGFYRSLGATPMTDWTVHRVDGAALGELAAML